GERACLRDDTLTALAARLDTLPKGVRDTTRIAIGRFRGLRFGLVLHPQFSPDVYLEGKAIRQSMLAREHHGPRAVLNALERLVEGYTSECTRVRQDLTIAEAQLRDYKDRLGKPFTHEHYFAELTALRDQLKSHLSGVNQDAASETAPDAGKLAAR